MNFVTRIESGDSPSEIEGDLEGSLPSSGGSIYFPLEVIIIPFVIITILIIITPAPGFCGVTEVNINSPGLEPKQCNESLIRLHF